MTSWHDDNGIIILAGMASLEYRMQYGLYQQHQLFTTMKQRTMALFWQ